MAFDLPSEEQRETLLENMIANDFLGLRSGPQAIRFRPPLNLRISEADDALTRLERALAQVA